MSTDIRIGTGFDVHAFGDGDHLMLGGVRVPHERGVLAHSDGDVALHALCDAILGALALGDIGVHFPPSDERWRGADSVELLRHSCAHVLATAICRLWPDAQLAGGPMRRMLIPLGLHHIPNSYVWFLYGDYQTPDGHVVTGELTRFAAGDGLTARAMSSSAPGHSSARTPLRAAPNNTPAAVASRAASMA